MTVPYRGFTVALLAAMVMAAAAACSESPGQGQGTAAPSSSASASSGSPVAPAAQVPAGQSATPLAVPAGDGSGALSRPHTLTVPADWTARVWARVPDARMEAWTPGGDLLVSDPDGGKIMELRPGAAGTAAVTILLGGLTYPQGMAFARLDGRWVLYVAESDQIDRYPWGAGGINGARTVIAARLPDLDPDGDDVHRAKDVTVAADGTVYFNVGSSSNASPGDRAMSPQRAVIMAVSPGGTDLRVVERGVRNGEGLAVAPDGTVWTAVNERDNIPYPSHRPYGTYSDAFGQVIRGYVNNHPPDEVVPVTAARDLGWPYCDPDQDDSDPAGVARRRPAGPRRGHQPRRDRAGLRGAGAGRGRASRAQCPAGHDLPGGQQDPGTVVRRRRDCRAWLVGPPAAAAARRAVAGLERLAGHTGARGHPGRRIREPRRQLLGTSRRRGARPGRRPVRK